MIKNFYAQSTLILSILLFNCSSPEPTTIGKRVKQGSVNQSKPISQDNADSTETLDSTANTNSTGDKEGSEPTTPTPSDDSENNTNTNAKNIKPFGLFGPLEFLLDGDVSGYDPSGVSAAITDLGVNWLQEMPPGVNLLPSTPNMITRVGKEGGYQMPNGNIEAYKQSLKTEIAKIKSRAKYFEVDTEPSGAPPPMGWVGYEQQYYNLLKASYEVIKAECSECKIVLGGVPGVGNQLSKQNTDFYKKILELGAWSYFDVFSFKHHHFDAKDYTFVKDRLEDMKSLFSPYGKLSDKIVFLETSTYDGNPEYSQNSPLSFLKFTPQSEKQHAANTIKLLMYSKALGVDVILLNLLLERYNFANEPGNPFNFYGLINNPQNNDNYEHKKIAFLVTEI